MAEPTFQLRFEGDSLTLSLGTKYSDLGVFYTGTLTWQPGTVSARLAKGRTEYSPQELQTGSPAAAPATGDGPVVELTVVAEKNADDPEVGVFTLSAAGADEAFLEVFGEMLGAAQPFYKINE